MRCSVKNNACVPSVASAAAAVVVVVVEVTLPIIYGRISIG